MDTLRGHEAIGERYEADYGPDDSAMEAPPGIGTDERRMHVRAYNYWTSLLGDRCFPSIEDLNPEQIEDFGPHSVLLDFTGGIDNPAVPYLGAALRMECEIEGIITYISDVPARSLLSRLTDHYLQIIANAAPIGFEAEFTNQRGVDIMYRGILMPFSSDDDTIDFVYGVINWKEVASTDLTDALVLEVDQALRAAPHVINTTPIWADGPVQHGIASGENMTGVTREAPQELELALGDVESLGPDAILADWLALARDSAEQARSSEARGRAALYQAIGRAYDFAVATADAHDDYAEMLDDAGIKVQARSPMTALVKLVFGPGYDKTRITEIVTALDHGWAEGLAPGSFASYLESYPGGLKGLVAHERAERRKERPTRPDPASAARAQLRLASPMTADSIATDAEGFAVLVARRESDGSLAIVGALDATQNLASQVVCKVATAR